MSAGNFIQRFMDKSNCLELLSLKRVMSQRLDKLMSNPVSDNLAVDIQFVTDSKKFESAVEECFGHFKLRDDSAGRNQSVFGREPERQASVTAISEVRPSHPLSCLSIPSHCLISFSLHPG